VQSLFYIVVQKTQFGSEKLRVRAITHSETRAYHEECVSKMFG